MGYPARALRGVCRGDPVAARYRHADAIADGRAVKGFICEPQALVSATDITEWGGWKAWLARHQSA
ncbi:Allophanate hydrolase [Cronobacter malonaticus 681]|nr:Allophanate hydrolase [Cronobacter malonaticus 681]